MTYLFNKNVNPQNNNVVVSITNPLPVTGNMGINGDVTVDFGPTGTSAFGELSTVSTNPIVQLDAIYGINNFDFTKYTQGTGSSANTDANSELIIASSGTAANGYSSILSRKYMKYRPGQGAVCRFTAAFTPNTATTIQKAGFTDTEVGLCVGYNGTDFGILRETGGKVAIYELGVTAAPNATQNVTVTLNSVSTTFPIHSGNSTNAAVEIFNDGTTNYPNWLVEQVANTVIFRSIFPTATPGTFSFSSTGNATANIVQIQAGANSTQYWVKQEDFNIDCLGKANTTSNTMGPNPSGMTLLPQYLNVYQINFRWLGAGVINFAIENSETGKMINFHQIRYSNRNAIPHISNPSFRIGYVVNNNGATSNTHVSGASMMMGIEGIINANKVSKAASANTVSLSKDTAHNVLSLRNSYTYNNKLNALSLNLRRIGFAVESNDPVEVLVFQNAVLNSALAFVDIKYSCATMSTTATTINLQTNQPIASFQTGVNGVGNIDIFDLLISEPPGSVITFAVKSGAIIARASISATWTED
jgi:hypothetical protein